MSLNVFELKYWAEKISLKKSAGQLERLSSLLARSTIDLNPYQIQATIFAFNSPLSRGAILADEVGLGKTIEAGIVLSQLWLEDKKRILLIVPASLRTQWREELETHFGLQSTILDSEYFEGQINRGEKVPMTHDGIYIASLPFVYKRIKLVQKQPWNLVVVDEAHRLRRVYRGKDASKMAFALREAIADKPKLLLTATPLQNNLLELYGLVSFIDDKLLGNVYHFKTRFVDKIIQSPSLKNETLKLLRQIIVGNEYDNFSPSGVITRTLRRQVKEYVKFPPRNSLTQDFTPTEKEQDLYEKVSAYLQREHIAAIETTQRNLMVLVYRKLLASSSFAIAPTLKRLYERLEEELRLREQESANETIEEVEAIEEEVEAEELEIIEKKLSRTRISADFNDEQLESEIQELKEYYQLATSIKQNTKGEALIRAIIKIFELAKKKRWPEKVVVFTESTRTQAYIETLLKESKIDYIPFNGSNNSKIASEAFDKWKKEFPELAINLSRTTAIRQALVYAFQTDPKKKVFLTTEAGSEGLNLQFANLLVNYDLPWNPQRIEQRIGRVHRYGQKYEVIIANLLNTKNYADQRVLELLTEKLGLFDGLFGSSDEILGSIESGIDFEQRILEIYQKCKTPEEIDTAFKKLQESLKGSVSADITKIRELMMDHLDPSITKLFRKTQLEVSQVLSEYDEALLRLCRVYWRENLKEIDTGQVEIKTNGKSQRYLFREEKQSEKGKISRVHNDHPLIRAILNEAATLTTNPIPTLGISLRNMGKLHDKFKVAQEGLIYVFKLVVSAVEDDEILVPLSFLKTGDIYKSLDIETSRLLTEAESKILQNNISKSPLTTKELYDQWDQFKKEMLAKYETRNEKLYSREMDRIHRFWDNFSLKTKDNIEKIKDEISQLKRRRENSIDFNEKRELDQKIQKAELRLNQMNINLIKEEQEALTRKQKDVDLLNEKLTMKIEDKLIAVASFIIQ